MTPTVIQPSRVRTSPCRIAIVALGERPDTRAARARVPLPLSPGLRRTHHEDVVARRVGRCDMARTFHRSRSWNAPPGRLQRVGMATSSRLRRLAGSLVLDLHGVTFIDSPASPLWSASGTGATTSARSPSRPRREDRRTGAWLVGLHDLLLGSVVPTTDQSHDEDASASSRDARPHHVTCQARSPAPRLNAGAGLCQP